MAENRRDNVTRKTFERLMEQTAERTAERVVAKVGRELVLNVLNEIAPQDMTDKIGREQFRKVLSWAEETKRRCDAIRDKAWSYGLPGSVVVLLGVVWASSDKIAAVFKAVK